MNDRKIVLVGLLPVLLQKNLGRFTLGKDQNSGGLAIQAMDDVDPVSGAGITLPDIVVQNRMGRFRLVPLRPHRQQAARFFHDDDILVLVKDRKPFGLIFGRRAFSDSHGTLS